MMGRVRAHEEPLPWSFNRRTTDFQLLRCTTLCGVSCLLLYNMLICSLQDSCRACCKVRVCTRTAVTLQQTVQATSPDVFCFLIVVIARVIRGQPLTYGPPAAVTSKGCTGKLLELCIGLRVSAHSFVDTPRSMTLPSWYRQQ